MDASAADATLDTAADAGLDSTRVDTPDSFCGAPSEAGRFCVDFDDDAGLRAFEQTVIKGDAAVIFVTDGAFTSAPRSMEAYGPFGELALAGFNAPTASDVLQLDFDLEWLEGTPGAEGGAEPINVGVATLNFGGPLAYLQIRAGENLLGIQSTAVSSDELLPVDLPVGAFRHVRLDVSFSGDAGIAILNAGKSASELKQLKTLAHGLPRSQCQLSVGVVSRAGGARVRHDNVVLLWTPKL